MTDERFVTEFLRFVGDTDLDLEAVFPRSTADGGVRLIIGCNDFFYWGTADGEELTPADLPLLRQCVDDLKAAEKHSEDHCWLLFCARKRGMRPQRPFFRAYSRKEAAYVGDQLSPPVRALFDACGPDGSDVNRG